MTQGEDQGLEQECGLLWPVALTPLSQSSVSLPRVTVLVADVVVDGPRLWNSLPRSGLKIVSFLYLYYFKSYL